MADPAYDVVIIECGVLMLKFKIEEMNIKDIFKWMILAAWTLLWSGCSDFLNEESQDEVIPKTVTDFSELLMGSGYPDVSSYAGAICAQLDDDKEMNWLGQELSGNVLGSTAAEEWYPMFTWQPDMFRRNEGVVLASTEYYQFYERIKGCNAVLDYIGDAIGTEAEREKVKAEALALRAYYYFWLVNLYGEPYNYNKTALGVPLKLVSAVDEEIGGPRETVEKVYERILEDLNASARLFEKYEVVIGNYRINLPAVKVLLSRVYLYMEQWDDAVQAATEAIRLGKGLSDLASLEDSEFGGMNSYTMTETLWIFGASIANFSNAFTFSSDLLNLYTANDKRMGMYITEDYTWDGTILRGYIFNKCSATNEPGQCLRLAEAYLNRAEAYAQMPDKRTEALSDLNELRSKRIVGYVDVNITNPEALLDTIRKERRLELCFEGHRWFDLRRYGMPEVKHVYQESETAPKMVYTLKEQDRMYTLPIPPSVMEKNSQLVQNVSDSEPLRQGVVE